MGHPHYGNPGSRLPQDVQDRIVELAQRPGATRNGIARELKVSGASVSGVVKRAGLSFDRSKVAAATAAKTADIQARRKELSAALIEDAHRLRKQMWAPAKIYNFGGKDNTYEEREVDLPPVADQLKIMQAAGAAIAKHIDLERHDADQGSENAKSMLGELGRALGIRPVDDSA